MKLKTAPFVIQTHFNNSKTGHVLFLDHDYIWFKNCYSNIFAVTKIEKKSLSVALNCCVFRPAFRFWAHPKAGQNTLLCSISTLFFDFRCILVIFS